MEDSLKKYQIRMMALIGGLILAFTFSLSGILLLHNERSTKENIRSLVSANNQQISINIGSYLDSIRIGASLMFSDKAYYAFDATDPSLSDYDKIQGKDAVARHIFDLALLQNYSDFGVVYADDSDTGWISQGTNDMFPDGGMYEAFSSCITDEETEEGWTFGVKGVKDRIWYIKRLNEHAILLVSFYSHELEKIFSIPQDLGTMTVRLVGSGNTVLYSNRRAEIGTNLPGNFSEGEEGTSVCSRLGRNEIVAGNSLGNGWRIISVLSLDEFNSESRKLQYGALFFALAIYSVFLIVLIIASGRVGRPVSSMVRSLDMKASHDQLTSLLNKTTYESLAAQSLASGRQEGYFVYLIMDVDEFKEVNDTYGHETGDRVLAGMGRILMEICSQNAIIGRVGGDEFSAFSFHNIPLQELKVYVEKTAGMIQDRVSKMTVRTTDGAFFSVSMGIAIAPAGIGMNFRKLYTSADQLLYEVKKQGKGSYKVGISGEEADSD